MKLVDVATLDDTELLNMNLIRVGSTGETTE